MSSQSLKIRLSEYIRKHHAVAKELRDEADRIDECPHTNLYHKKPLVQAMYGRAQLIDAMLDELEKTIREAYYD